MIDWVKERIRAKIDPERRVIKSYEKSKTESNKINT